jgi:5-amino-6-(5-phospho-D-ribitylamino)uracil phosphatase
MKIHLVAIDLDGTLLNSSKQITAATSAMLRKARRQTGVKIVLASARPPRSVKSFYNSLELDTPMINYNGALVIDPPSGRILLHRPIPIRTAQRIVALSRRRFPEVLVSAEILDRWCTDRLDVNYVTETSKNFAPDVLAPIDVWLVSPVTKLLLLGEEKKLMALADDILDEFNRQVTIVKTDENLLQIMHATVSKAKALRAVAGELGVTRQQVMAIGDNDNDVDMLQWADIAVAMDNATPAVKAVADYVTDHHDADGVARAIERLIIEGLPQRKGTRQ